MTWLGISGTGGKVAACLGFFVLGAIIFSVLTMVIYRLPDKKKMSKPVCTKCNKELAFKDYIPIFSYIGLKGKCRYCGEKIPVRYIGIELFGGITAVVMTGYFGMNFAGLIYFLFVGILTVITFIDFDTMEIPPVLNISILVLGVIAIFAIGDVTIVERLIGMICISLPLFIIVLIIPEGFGGGDIKLMFAAGFLLGWKRTVIGFFIGLILGGIYGAICLAGRKKGKKDHFAFGPFLAVGLAASLFCGTQLMDAYIEYMKAALNPDIYY